MVTLLLSLICCLSLGSLRFLMGLFFIPCVCFMASLFFWVTFYVPSYWHLICMTPTTVSIEKKCILKFCDFILFVKSNCENMMTKWTMPQNLWLLWYFKVSLFFVSKQVFMIVKCLIRCLYLLHWIWNRRIFHCVIQYNHHNFAAANAIIWYLGL